MATPVFPNGIKQWTDKVDFVDDVSAAHINEAYAEIIAIETELHGATPNATPNEYIKRDANGRAKVAAPSNSDDIARKKEVDDVQQDLDSHKLELATSSKAGHIKLTDIPTPPVSSVAGKTGAVTVTKADVGLPNVDNVKQMPITGGTFTGKTIFQNNTDYSKQGRNITLSTADPSGGASGDVWIKYKA